MARMSGGVIGAAAVLGLGLLAGIWAFWGQPEVAPEPAPQGAATAPAATASPDAPAVAEPPAPLAVLPPRFDVVRVDGAGLATIAGTAAPQGVVVLRLDGVEIGRATADGAGQFAALLTLPPSDRPRLLSLALIQPDGGEVADAETVAIGPVVVAEAAQAEAAAQQAAQEAPDVDKTPDPPAPPAALLVSDTGARVLQGPEAADLPVSIDSISYGAAGEVLLSGRASPGAALRLYLDDAPVADLLADEAGDWQTGLADVAGGVHSLRLDAVDGAGKVVSRFETPFKRDLPTAPAAPAMAETAKPAAPSPDLAPAVAAAPITITVQPGFTLWAIARENFGEGMMYVQVFEANRDKIKDPDLIYPGQVFTVPKP